MRFEDVIAIRRGGHPKEERPEGSYRVVAIRYLGARNGQIYGELTTDDPLAIPPGKAGDRMWWSCSAVRWEIPYSSI